MSYINVLKGQEMGARGAFDRRYGRTGGIPLENRHYSSIGKLGNIKVIQCDDKSNNPSPTYSNTANTTYFSYSKENKRIERICYYKDHKLVKTVDFKPGEEPHVHYWNGTVVGRKAHDKNNHHALSDRDKRLMKLAQSYNNQIKSKK